MARFSEYIAALRDSIEARVVTIDAAGPLDGMRAVTWQEVESAIAAVPIPPPDEETAELSTPATVYLTARCHICGESAELVVSLESKTVVDDKRRIIAAKVDAGQVTHTCGQLTAFGKPVTDGMDWTIPAGDVEPEAPAADEPPAE